MTPSQVAALLKQGSITRAEASYLLVPGRQDVTLDQIRSMREVGVRSSGATQPAQVRSFGSSGGVETLRSNVDYPFVFVFSSMRRYTAPANFGVGRNRTILPVAPPSFEYSIKNNAQTFTAMSGRTFAHAGAEDLMRISFETFLPAGLTHGGPIPTYVHQSTEGGLFEPPAFVKKVQDAQKSNMPFLFSVLHAQAQPLSGVIIPPTPMTIMDFTPSYNAGQGHDVGFSISLQKWNAQGSGQTSGTQVYITKKGDKYHCGNIALEQLRDVLRAPEIKRINRVVLDHDHALRIRQKRTNPRILIRNITPGTRLLIPTKSLAGTGV